MNNTSNSLSLYLVYLFATIFIAQSCTVQKRTVNKGYFVQWNINKGIDKSLISNKKEIKSESTIEETQTISVKQNEISTSKDETKQEIVVEKVIEPTKVPVLYENVIHNKSKSKIDFKESPRKNLLNIKPFQKVKRIAPPAMDSELLINFILIFVFLGLGILFLMLALKAIEIMLIVYWVLAIVCFVLFITQVIDVIMY